MPKFGVVKDRRQLQMFDEPKPAPVYQEPVYIERHPPSESDKRVIDAVAACDEAYLAYVQALNYGADEQTVIRLKQAYNNMWDTAQNVLVKEWKFKV